MEFGKVRRNQCYMTKAILYVSMMTHNDRNVMSCMSSSYGPCVIHEAPHSLFLPCSVYRAFLFKAKLVWNAKRKFDLTFFIIPYPFHDFYSNLKPLLSTGYQCKSWDINYDYRSTGIVNSPFGIGPKLICALNPNLSTTSMNCLIDIGHIPFIN